MADSQDDKLYKAEYAKSGRASRKLCQENIAKDSLRMAIIVQSPMFDGKVPHWHHFSCFWFRAAVKSPSDISGFTDLRWDDQEKVKKAIKSGSQNKKLYKAEYAKSRRTSCMLCQENIAKDSLRMAIMVQSPMFDGKVPHWHHFSCFWLRAAVQSPSDISGLTDLHWDDQEKVKKAIESRGATGGPLYWTTGTLLETSRCHVMNPKGHPVPKSRVVSIVTNGDMLLTICPCVKDY